MLGAASFYYQFIRENRGLTAQFLSGGKLEGGQTRWALLVRNTGNRDEVINEASFVVESPLGVELASRSVFPADVVKAGEAKRIEASALRDDWSELVESFDYQYNTRNLGPPPRRHPISLRIVVVDDLGRWIFTRLPLGHLDVGIGSNLGVGIGYQSGRVLDLLHPQESQPAEKTADVPKLR